jgi:hypothetical protein
MQAWEILTAFEASRVWLTLEQATQDDDGGSLQPYNGITIMFSRGSGGRSNLLGKKASVVVSDCFHTYQTDAEGGG